MAKRQKLGNPYAIAAASSAISNPEIVKGAGTVLKIAGVGLVGYFGYKVFKSYQQKQLMQEVISNPNSKAAIDIYYAIPAGLKKGDGSLFNPLGFITDLKNTISSIWQRTDTDRLMTVAVNIKDFDDTASKFQKLYGEPLYPLLQKVLSESELQTFVNKSSSNGTVTRTNVALRDLVFSKKNINLRSAPDATYSGGISDIMDILKNNIIGTSRIGDFLGWVLSGPTYDSKNNVWFIQVGFKVMTAQELQNAGITSVPQWVKNAMGKTYVRWVSASTDLVDIFRYYNTASSKYPLGYSTIQYLLPIK